MAEVVRRAACASHPFPLRNTANVGRVAVVAVDVAQHADELRECRGIEPAVLFQTVARAGAELLEVPASLGDADHRDVEMTALDHRLQRRKDLLEGEISRRAEAEPARSNARPPARPLGFRCILAGLSLRRLFDVSAEFEAHGGEQLVLEHRLAARD